ncbi:VOC family protein [Cupriavidus sp. 30B13]|uniref:VOC family protein n=1 Tax=Cupriavidus sp. 30B13 TaxID=3384241 RepID=UPI003B8FBD95
MLTQPRYVIGVPDLARSASYYRDVLGFKVSWEELPGWRLFVRDACIIMAGECPDAMPVGATGDHAYIAYIQVQEIDKLHAELAERGANVIKPLRTEPWEMREFAIETVDGHRMMFGEPCAG